MKRYFISFCFLLTFVKTQQQKENDILQTPIVGVELSEAGFHR